jgi:hypothetical protein
MNFGPKNEQHRKALRLACETLLLPGMPADAAADLAARADTASLAQVAFLALALPEEGAVLVRALLQSFDIEPCAVPYPGFEDMKCCRAKDHVPPHADCVGDDGYTCVNPEHHAQDWMGKPKPIEPALVLALLDAKDAPGALAACKEHGR